MKLGIKDRLVLLQVIPGDLELSFSEFMAKKAFMNKLTISDEDKKEFEIETDEASNSIKWNVKKDIENPLTIEIDQATKEWLKKTMEAISDKKYTDSVWDTLERVFNGI